MNNVEYFKFWAKKLHQSYKNKSPYIDITDSNVYYQYEQKYLDVNSIFLDFDLNEDEFSLSNSKDVIANLVGFKKWQDLIKASDVELELAKLLFENQRKISIEEWQDYITNFEKTNEIILNDENKLEIFKYVFANADGHFSFYQGYLKK